MVHPTGTASETPQTRSIIEVVANPDKFDGKLISVIGYLRIEFEGDALYLHEEDYLHGLVINSLWIELPDKVDNVVEQLQSLSSNYIFITGEFDAKKKGHMGMHAGTIKPTGKFGLWSKPSCPRRRPGCSRAAIR
jgi:hypothetical protein